MIETFIRAVIRWRVAIWTVVAVAVLLSARAIQTASRDAIADMSEQAFVVYVKWPRRPLLVESEATAPLVSALAGSPDIQTIRGTSHMGSSFIYVILTPQADHARVRQLVMDRINTIRPQLPPDANVTLGPN